MKRLASKSRVAALALSLAAFGGACGVPDTGAGTEDDGDPKFGDEDDSGDPGDDGDSGNADSNGESSSDSGESSADSNGDDSADSSSADSSADSGGGDGDSAADSSGGDGDSAADADGGDGDSATDAGDGDSASDSNASDTTDADSGSDETTTTGGSADCFGPTELPSSNEPWEQPEDPKVPGAVWPYWQAEDFQPLSCLYGETYGPNAFLGTVTVFINWRATCSYCQAQASKFEELRIELKLMGHDVYFAGLNQVGYDDPAQQVLLSDLVSFNLMQGTAEYDLWALQAGAKDALYIYDTTGHLVEYIDPLGEVSTNMNTTEGYDNVKNAVLAALGG